jgi:hypothetical protein
VPERVTAKWIVMIFNDGSSEKSRGSLSEHKKTADNSQCKGDNKDKSGEMIEENYL